VNSSPVQISISGGLPDSSHFSITPEKLNIPGGVVSGITDGIDVLVEMNMAILLKPGASCILRQPVALFNPPQRQGQTGKPPRI